MEQRTIETGGRLLFDRTPREEEEGQRDLQRVVLRPSSSLLEEELHQSRLPGTGAAFDPEEAAVVGLQCHVAPTRVILPG